MTLSPDANEWIDWATQHFNFVKGNAGRSDAYPTATGDLGAAELATVMLPSMQDWYNSNDPTVKWIHRCVVASALAVVVQMVCWAAAFH